MTNDRRYRLITLLSLCVLCHFQLWAQQRNTQEEYNVDSTLYAYYMRCKAEVLSPIVLQMSDTLFYIAKEKKDQRMQAVALCTILDYYYYKNDKDSIISHVEQVKNFAHKTDQPKYFYFAWSKRLINYYLKQHQYNIALYEAQKMMEEAEDKDDVSGLANAYDALSNVYLLKGMKKQAAEFLTKGIEIRQKYDIDKFNLSNSYSALAQLNIAMNQLPLALENLKKSQNCIFTPSQEYCLYVRSTDYYLAMNEPNKAWEYLRKAKQMIDIHKSIQTIKHEYYSALSTYYYATGQYNKSLAALDSVNRSQEALNNFIPNRFLVFANIYWKLGDLNNAITLYQKYIAQNDSLDLANEDIATGEFAAMLGVERLNQEKGELQQQIQYRELKIKKFVIIFLIVLLAVGLLLIYRERLLNRKLRFSQKLLSESNRELLLSQNQLKAAKERAEDASHMKTEFIQNMSHEIRTPLNSIVGFAQILSSYFSNDDETKEFATIIEQGSTNLLHLVNNVLDLSSLDNKEEIMMQNVADVTGICQTCADQIINRVKPGVVFYFIPERENFYMQTSPDRLTQILTNLLLNAIKFTSEGEIRFSYRINEERKLIVFNVLDTGIGIPEDKREFVFERFSKINTFVPGTGLGLAISKLIAEKMNGSLIIDPNYTTGCCFVLTLPIVD